MKLELNSTFLPVGMSSVLDVAGGMKLTRIGALNELDSAINDGSVDSTYLATQRRCRKCRSRNCLLVKKTRGFYLPEQVAQHNRADDCWIIANGVVYDVTRYLAKHPGGARSILLRAGKDASQDYAFHTMFSKDKLWGRYAIGRLAYCNGGASVDLNSKCVIS